MVTAYARWMGVAIIIVGGLGLILGEGLLLGLVNIDILEDIAHLLTGGLMAYAGYVSRDLRTIRTVVGGVGVVYLLAGILGFITPTLFGLLPTGFTVFDNILHIALGIAGIAVAWFIEGRPIRATATR